MVTINYTLFTMLKAINKHERYGENTRIKDTLGESVKNVPQHDTYIHTELCARWG